MVMDEFKLPDGRTVKITERALRDFNDHDNCSFCAGRAAAHRGESKDSNPFPPGDLPPASPQRYESDHWLWMAGHEVGATEPGGLLWYEQPNRG